VLKLKEKIDAIEIEIKNNGKNIDSIKEMVLDIHSVQVSPDSGEKSGIDNDEDIEDSEDILVTSNGLAAKQKVAAYFGIYRKQASMGLLNGKPMYKQIDTLPKRWERRYYQDAFLYYNGVNWRVYSREKEEAWDEGGLKSSSHGPTDWSFWDDRWVKDDSIKIQHANQVPCDKVAISGSQVPFTTEVLGEYKLTKEFSRGRNIWTKSGTLDESAQIWVPIGFEGPTKWLVQASRSPTLMSDSAGTLNPGHEGGTWKYNDGRMWREFKDLTVSCVSP